MILVFGTASLQSPIARSKWWSTSSKQFRELNFASYCVTLFYSWEDAPHFVNNQLKNVNKDEQLLMEHPVVNLGTFTNVFDLRDVKHAHVTNSIRAM